MFGGAHRWGRGRGAVAGGAAVALVVVVLVVGRPAGRLADEPLVGEVQTSLAVLGGILLFAAGLLHVLTWRLRRDLARGRLGLLLLAVGLLAPRVSSLGPVVHEDRAAAVLSPWTAALVAVLALAAAGAGPDRLGSVAPHVRTALAVAVGALLALPYLPLVVVHALPAPLDVPAPVHVLVELAVAGLWFGAAARARGGVAAHRAVVALLGAVWLLRALAAVELQPATLLAATLFALVGLAALSTAVVEYARCADAERQRLARADAALAAAARTFEELDAQRRSFRHSVRNSMFALRAASEVLAVHGADLDAATRRRLRDAVVGELARLEEHLAQGADPTRPHPVDLVARASA